MSPAVLLRAVDALREARQSGEYLFDVRRGDAASTSLLQALGRLEAILEFEAAQLSTKTEVTK